MTRYILLVGAYDRDNFGDILFPKIYEYFFPGISLVKGGLMGRDLHNIGGYQVVPTKFFLDCQRNNFPLAVIHCGGEILTLPKTSGVSMNLHPDTISRVGKYYPGNEYEIAEKVSSSVGELAYVYDYSKYKQSDGSLPFKLIYNSVGGSDLRKYKDRPDYLSEISRRVKQSDYVSVRDYKTRTDLDSMLNVEAKLSPDVVGMISTTNRQEILNASKNSYVKNIIKNPYILLQANKELILSTGVNKFAKICADLSFRVLPKIVLQPAGTAGGHGSLELLKEVACLAMKKNPGVDIVVQEDRNIWNLLSVISNAKCAVCSSLHVRVVTLSYGIPCVSFCNNKVSAYAKTWEMDKRPYNIVPENIVTEVEKVIDYNREDIFKASKLVEDKIEKNMRQVGNIINNSSSKSGLRGLNKHAFFEAISKETDTLRDALVFEIVEKNRYRSQLKRIKNKKAYKLYVLVSKLVKAVHNTIKGSMHCLLLPVLCSDLMELTYV